MEVHAHAHTPRKRWTHYLWEFIMLFLAVFCGFLAEYQLEHKIESDRGKQYIQSFYEDIVTDSSQFSEIIKDFQSKSDLLQELPACYDSLLRDGRPNKTLSLICRSTQTFKDLIYTDRTLMQLKNAGGLRLLKKADADSILLYDNLLRAYKTAETTGFQEIQSQVRASFYKLRNYKAWIDSSHTSKLVSLNLNNQELLNEYFNQLSLYKIWCEARLNRLKKLKSSNTALITFLRTKYDLAPYIK